MKDRNLNHSDDWATPPEFYNKLNDEFHFDFDPCPFQHDMSWDWTEIDWGGAKLYKSSVQSKDEGKICPESNRGIKKMKALRYALTSFYQYKIISRAYSSKQERDPIHKMKNKIYLNEYFWRTCIG
jgi:hypothetical protein